MSVWTEIQDRANDIERQEAENMGVGDYCGNETGQRTLRQTIMPSEEA